MALIYKNFAIVSLGMSCQGAHQIELNKDALDDIMGEVSTKRRTPLDFLVAPPVGAAALVRRQIYYPRNANVLRHLDGKRYHWEHRGIWYLHDANARERFPDLSQRFAHMGANLKRIGKRPTLAVWSNSQRNLSDSLVDRDLDYIARQSELDMLLKALRKHCPRAEMLNVVAQDRTDSADPLRSTEHVPYESDDHPDDWRGDNTTWTTILSDALQSDRIQRLIAGQTH